MTRSEVKKNHWSAGDEEEPHRPSMAILVSRVFELTQAERELGEVTGVLKRGRGGARGLYIAGGQGRELGQAPRVSSVQALPWVSRGDGSR